MYDSQMVEGAGVALHVRQGGRRDGPTIVFIHGYPDSSVMWDPVLAELADRYHVVAYDVRGAGKSGAPRTS